MEDIRAWWTGLPPETRRVVLTAATAIVVMRSVGTLNAILVAGAAWYLNNTLPSQASFMPWFERWFKEQYFPKLAERLRFEFDQRSNQRRSLFDSLSDKVSSWWVGTTKGLQGAFVYELLDKRPLFSDLYFCRLASMNLSSRSQPNFVSFVGIHGKWMLAPWHTLDFDNMSILNEVDKRQGGRGGASDADD